MVKGGSPFYSVAGVSSNARDDMGGSDIRLPKWTLLLDEPVKTASYPAMSNAWLKPQLRH
jgi:hypothetical protein